jgi:hypothetical protein
MAFGKRNPKKAKFIDAAIIMRKADSEKSKWSLRERILPQDIDGVQQKYKDAGRYPFYRLWRRKCAKNLRLYQ